MTDPLALETRFAKKCRRTGHHRWGIATDDYNKTTPSEVRFCRRPTCGAVKQWVSHTDDTVETAYLHRVDGEWGVPALDAFTVAVMSRSA